MLASVLLMLSVSSTSSPSDASGLDDPGGGNCHGIGGSLRYAFSGIGWVQVTGTAPNQVTRDLRYGTNTPFNAVAWAESWEGTALDLDGGGPNMQEAWGDVVITFTALSGVGYSSCNGGFIQIDDRYRMNPTDGNLANEMRGVLRHELGHTMGLYHTGSAADQASGTETMATCNSANERSTSSVTSDEWGSWLFHNSDQDDNNVLPNPGFEKGGAAWAKVGGVFVQHYTTGARTGSRRVRLRNDAPGDYRAAMFISDDSQRTINVEMWTKALSGLSQSGFVNVVVRFLPKYFGADGCGTYASGRNERSITSTGSWQTLTSYSRRAVSSSWRELQTTAVQAPSNSGIILIVVTTTQNYTSNSNPASIFIDDLSVRAN